MSNFIVSIFIFILTAVIATVDGISAQLPGLEDHRLMEYKFKAQPPWAVMIYKDICYSREVDFCTYVDTLEHLMNLRDEFAQQFLGDICIGLRNKNLGQDSSTSYAQARLYFFVILVSTASLPFLHMSIQDFYASNNFELVRDSLFSIFNATPQWADRRCIANSKIVLSDLNFKISLMCLYHTFFLLNYYYGIKYDFFDIYTCHYSSEPNSQLSNAAKLYRAWLHFICLYGNKC